MQPSALERAAFQGHGPRGARFRKCRIVGDDDHERAARRNIAYDLDQLAVPLRIESRRRLVEKKQLGVVNERPSDGNPLPLPARARPKRAIRVGAEIEAREHVSHLHVWNSVELGRESEILAPRKVGVTKALVPEPTEPLADIFPVLSELAEVHAAARRRRERAENR